MSTQHAAREGWKILLGFIKERQSELEITDYRLAKMAGVDVSTISRYMSGEREPGIVNFLAILGALDINPYLVPKDEDSTDFNYFITFN